MKRTPARLLAAVAIASVAIAYPFLITVPYYLHLGILALVWVILAQGQNLVQGYTGYVSIAQGGFMGVGAYVSTILSVKLGWPVWATIALAPVATGVFALLVGYPSLRVKGHYFAIVTLAYNMVIYVVLMNFTSLTGGESGIPKIPRPESFTVPGLGEITFGSRLAYYYLALAWTALAMLAAALVVRSRVGRVMVSIRQNEALADALGVACWRYKLFAFVASAVFAGLSGALFAHYMGYVNPAPFAADTSLNAILAVILGGSGTLTGPVVGAAVVIFLPEYLRVAETYRLIAYGLILVLATIFMPRGIVPIVEAGWRRWRGRRLPGAPERR